MLHSKTLSPSSAPALKRCAFFESDNAPSGEAAQLGTHLHSFLEALLKGRWFDFDDSKASEFDVEGVYWARDFIKRKIEELEGFEVDLQALFEEGLLKVEDRITIFAEDGFTPLTFGTADAVYKNLVFDYKSGEVKSHEEQLAFYSLGVMQRGDFEHIHAFEVFGRFRTLLDYQFSKRQASGVVAEAFDRKANPEKYGREANDYCKYCSHKIDCELLTGAADEVPALEFRLSDNKAIVEALSSGDVPLLQQNEGVVFNLYAFANAIEEWSKRVKSFIGELITSEQLTVQGLKITERKGSVTIDDLPAVAKISGLNQDRFLKACKLSLTDLAKEFEEVEIEELLGDALPEHLKTKRGAAEGRLKKTSKKDALEILFADQLSRKESSRFVSIDKLTKIKGDE